MRAMQKKLHAWYATDGRKDLPWRNTSDPYHIYISEIMLQQTQVKTVLERFYFPFLKTFPTLKSLADAPQDKVLKAWEGLGYYTRARNVHKTAQLAAPTLPDNVDALLALPGIGQNTAYAILAFGFHKPYPVMEANVKRVLCRMHKITKPDDKTLWQHAWDLLDTKKPFDHNQAMMDIGATLCTKTKPACDICPLSAGCAGKNTPEAYPAKKAKKATPTRQRMMVLFRTPSGKLHLSRGDERLLGGLYSFPQFEKGKPIIHHNTRYNPDNFTKLGSITHVYSHFKLSADVYMCDIAESEHCYSREEIKQLPLSKADLKALSLI